jgi:PAS domain-containing protein
LNLLTGGQFTIIGTNTASSSADCEDCCCQQLLMAALPSSIFDIQRCDRLTQAGAHLGIPLFANGKPAGILNSVSTERDGSFSERERRILVGVAAQISDALERIQLREALASRVEAGTRSSAADPRHDESELSRILSAIESMAGGFAVYDRDGRLLNCNERYRELHPHAAHLIVPGTHFQDLLRAGLECDGTSLRGPDDEQIRTRLEKHCLAEGVPTIQQLTRLRLRPTRCIVPAGPDSPPRFVRLSTE